jgi:hypothetical protein
MSRIPDRKDIVTEALKEINPAADEKAACEKEIRIYLSLLDDLRALKEESLSWPSPAEKKADMDRLAKTLKKAETILLLPTYQRNFRLMRPFLDYDRFMADLAKVSWTADYQVKHSVTQRRAKSFGLVKWHAAKYAVRLINKFGTGRPSKVQLGTTLLRGATGVYDINFEEVITAVHKADREP